MGDMRMPAEQREAEGLTRRSFYIGAIYGIWGIIAAALGLPAMAYLLLPPKVRKENEWVEIGDVSKLTPNSPVEMTFRRNRVDGWKILSEKSTAWAVKQDNGEVFAFAPQCTHLGCAYHWDDPKKQFLCPCHTSVFSIDGTELSQPAPRALDRLESKVEKNKLLLGEVHESKESAG